MKKSITIRIPEPCHEDWNKMTPTEQGKFCSVCTKEVFDFTKVSDEELVKKVYSNEKLCGRFKNSQLNREMKLERKSGLSFAPLAASFLLPFTLMASTKAGTDSKESKLQGKFISLNIGSLSENKLEKAQIITTGKITDENGKPISNIEIIVKKSGKSEVSGLRGDFKIASANDDTLIIKKAGFSTQEIKLGRKSSFLTIELKSNVVEILSGTLGMIAFEEVVEQKNDSISEKKQDSSKIVIKGIVTDNTGLPLPGVNIIEKGTANGTQTDFDGNYTIQIDKNQELVFSYVGFTTEEVTLSNINNKIDLQMTMSEEWLGEVVIVSGGISVDYSDEIMGYKKSTYNPEPTQWKKDVQTSLDNEKEYSKIKRERKKDAKELKRKKK